MEGSARDFDQHAVQPGGHAQDVEQADRDAGRELLQRRDQAGAERHRQKKIDQGKSQPAEHRRAEQRKRRGLQQRNQGELLDDQR